MPTKSSVLGQKIKRYRLVNDIRQEDMAEQLGVSRATLINYEKGHTVINVDILSKIKKNYPDLELDESSKPKILVDNAINFKVLANVLLSEKKYIFFFSLLFATLGTTSSLLLKDYYNAQISLYPAKNDQNQIYGQFQSLVSNLGVNSVNNDQNFNIPDVVKSRFIAEKVLKMKWKGTKGDSADLISFWNINKDPWYNFLFSTTIDSSVLIEGAIKKLDQRIEVSEDRMTGLIKISTTFQDPLIAASIANFIGSQVELYIQKENSAQSKKEKLFISDRLSIVKKELERLELEIKDFKERNRGYEESPDLFMIFSQLFREVEAKQEVYLTLQQQLELARIEEVKKSPILHILDHAVAPVYKSSPNRKLFLIISGLIGIIFSSLKIIFRY